MPLSSKTAALYCLRLRLPSAVITANALVAALEKNSPYADALEEGGKPALSGPWS